MPGPVPLASDVPVVRAAREADVDRLLEIHVAAYPDPRPLEVRRRVLTANRLGGLEHLRIVEQAGDLVAHAFAFPVGAWFGGKEVRGAAIASVAVAVEARGQGLATALLAAIHVEARGRGDAFTLLYPFREKFYGAMGYASVARQRSLDVSPRAIPESWVDAAPGVIRRARGDDRAGLARVYQAAASAGTGSLTRTDREWERDLSDERRQWLVLDSGQDLVGYVSVRLQQSQPHARVRAEVVELVASEDAPRRRLLAAVAALGDQVGDIGLTLADDDPLPWALVDADRDRAGTEDIEHALGVIHTGPMIRLLEPQRALLARGYAADGSVDLAVEGEPPFTLDVRDGVASVSARSSTQGSALSMTLTTLAAVAFGGLRLEDAWRLGWLGTDAEGARPPARVRAAGELLRIPTFFSVDAF